MCLWSAVSYISDDQVDWIWTSVEFLVTDAKGILVVSLIQI